MQSQHKCLSGNKVKLCSILTVLTLLLLDISITQHTHTDIVSSAATSKRRRGADLFSKEPAILGRLEAKAENQEKLKSIANQQNAQEISLSDVVGSKNEISEEVMIFILSSKLTMPGLITLATAIDHVRRAYGKVGHSHHENLRLYAINAIYVKAGFSIHEKDLGTYVNLIETRCHSLLVKKNRNGFDDTLWKATQEECFNFNCFMAPPVDVCLSCEKPLTRNNKPTKVTLFTLCGPIPSTALRLRCRECERQYGLCYYTDKNGQHLYTNRLTIIEATNVAYIDKMLYEWIPSLG